MIADESTLPSSSSSVREEGKQILPEVNSSSSLSSYMVYKFTIVIIQKVTKNNESGKGKNVSGEEM